MQSSSISKMPSGKQFVRTVRQWMKKHKIGSRKLAKLSGTSSGTLYKLIAKPDTISMATIVKYQKVMKSYRLSVASRPAKRPAKTSLK